MLAAGSHSTLPLADPNPGRLAAVNSEALAEAAEQFESIFTRILLDTAFKDGFAGVDSEGQGGHIRDMWVQQLASQMSQGDGLGLAQAMLRDFQTPAAVSGEGPLMRNQLLTTAIPAQSPADAEVGPKAPQTTDSSQLFASPDEFSATLRPLAAEAANKLGVPVGVVLAQAALESGWGEHQPGGRNDPSYNLFGLKADRSWQGPVAAARTREYLDQAWVWETTEFRRYGSYRESFSDYADFLQSQPRYQQALNHGGSAEDFVQGLAVAGYATDPEYANRVLQLAEQRYDVVRR